ncbi:MAG: hypothetical protein GYA55_04695 [SAR324 cluster bacterium]|uniref:Uncharacterized protein n=1 Tax=SAR324 cluster bacterium TaxID=2024889 RepID=A0A7X9FQH9_9DELT|nr:hypothetical protein [SAR324 cluster bacterium]
MEFDNKLVEEPMAFDRRLSEVLRTKNYSWTKINDLAVATVRMIARSADPKKAIEALDLIRYIESAQPGTTRDFSYNGENFDALFSLSLDIVSGSTHSNSELLTWELASRSYLADLIRAHTVDIVTLTQEAESLMQIIEPIARDLTAKESSHFTVVDVPNGEVTWACTCSITAPLLAQAFRNKGLDVRPFGIYFPVRYCPVRNSGSSILSMHMIGTAIDSSLGPLIIDPTYRQFVRGVLHNFDFNALQAIFPSPLLIIPLASKREALQSKLQSASAHLSQREYDTVIDTLDGVYSGIDEVVHIPGALFASVSFIVDGELGNYWRCPEHQKEQHKLARILLDQAMGLHNGDIK